MILFILGTSLQQCQDHQDWMRWEGCITHSTKFMLCFTKMLFMTFAMQTVKATGRLLLQQRVLTPLISY